MNDRLLMLFFLAIAWAIPSAGVAYVASSHGLSPLITGCVTFIVFCGGMALFYQASSQDQPANIIDTTPPSK